MGWVAKLKFLRGGALDVFGKTEERRMERALIGEYQALVEQLLTGLSAAQLPAAVALAASVDQIRGYGHVKHASVVKVKQGWAQGLAQRPSQPEMQTIQIRRAA